MTNIVMPIRRKEARLKDVFYRKLRGKQRPDDPSEVEAGSTRCHRRIVEFHYRPKQAL